MSSKSDVPVCHSSGYNVPVILTQVYQRSSPTMYQAFAPTMYQ